MPDSLAEEVRQALGRLQAAQRELKVLEGVLGSLAASAAAALDGSRSDALCRKAKASRASDDRSQDPFDHGLKFSPRSFEDEKWKASSHLHHGVCFEQKRRLRREVDDKHSVQPLLPPTQSYLRRRARLIVSYPFQGQFATSSQPVSPDFSRSSSSLKSKEESGDGEQQEPYFSRVVDAVCLSYAFVLAGSGREGRIRGDLQHAIEHSFLIFFVIEAVLQLTAQGFMYFLWPDPKGSTDYRRLFSRVRWSNWLDFVATSGGVYQLWLRPVLMALTPLATLGVDPIYLRLLRVGWVLVRFSMSRSELRGCVSGMILSIQTLMWLFIFLLMLIFIFGLLFFEMIRGHGEYTEMMEDGYPAIIHEFYFPDLGTTMLTLFNISVMAEWPEILWPVYWNQPVLVPVFMLYMFLSHLCLLNMLIGVVCERVTREEKALEDKETRKQEDVFFNHAVQFVDELFCRRTKCFAYLTKVLMDKGVKHDYIDFDFNEEVPELRVNNVLVAKLRCSEDEADAEVEIQAGIESGAGGHVSSEELQREVDISLAECSEINKMFICDMLNKEFLLESFSGEVDENKNQCMQSIAKSLPQHWSWGHLVELFDSNGNGELSRDEVLAVLTNLNEGDTFDFRCENLCRHSRNQRNVLKLITSLDKQFACIDRMESRLNGLCGSAASAQAGPRRSPATEGQQDVQQAPRSPQASAPPWSPPSMQHRLQNGGAASGPACCRAAADPDGQSHLDAAGCQPNAPAASDASQQRSPSLREGALGCEGGRSVRLPPLVAPLESEAPTAPTIDGPVVGFCVPGSINASRVLN